MKLQYGKIIHFMIKDLLLYLQCNQIKMSSFTVVMSIVLITNT